MTRGNRQGNNAFLDQGQSLYGYQRNPMDLALDLQRFYANSNQLPVETFRTLERLAGHGDVKQRASYQLHAPIRAGDAKLSAYVIKALWE
jgi:hypothetical protein